jgi:two-component system sensor histidine kinase KdpD
VDAALAKYRADNKITDTWEARERVVVAVTGGQESETLVRRASRIASRSSAELMVVHVVRGDGLSGLSAPQMGKVRELASALARRCTRWSATTSPRRSWNSPGR